ncbi:hypothetical protein H0R92_00260 [Treponema sp. OMZ 840]|uniref:DUF5692 family protein n=1 Tax=Treponema sp. OMZ 840 TaxID=244313 RepID=UPI003D93DA4D
MFFFTNYTWQNILIALAVLAGLILVNDLTRRSKWLSIAVYIVLPLVLTFTVWPKTAVRGSGDWFPVVKTYSALAGVIGFMAIRYIKGADTKKWLLFFPALILSINIAEAVYRDFEVYAAYAGQAVVNPVDGLFMQGGIWNILNAIAGIVLILTLTGIFGIRVAKTKSKDMIWPDQLWFWIIAYDLWNLSYCYNCISTRSMYAGLLLLLSCTISEFFLKKGAWLQHRAQTLALWAMFSITFSSYSTSPLFSITSSYKPAALTVISILSIVSNLAVLVYEIIQIKKTKRCPVTQDIYVDLKSYKAVLADNNLN